MILLVSLLTSFVHLSSGNPLFYSSITDQDRGVKDISSTSRQPRFNFYFGNGTAMVNTTTVAISTSFAVIVGLGLASLYSQARSENSLRRRNEEEAGHVDESDWVAHGQHRR